MPFDSFPAHQTSWFFWHSLTWFGDTTLLLPAGAALFVSLALTRGWSRLTVRWAVAFGLVGLTVLATKVAFMGWGIGSAALDFTGISGHSALSAAFWPVVCWLTTERGPTLLRRLAVAGGALLALAIGYSRLVLHAHSVSEVLSGLALGLAASAWFLQAAHVRERRGTLFAVLALAATAVLAVCLHGRPAPTTPLIERLVVQMLDLPRPYTRHDLHRRHA